MATGVRKSISIAVLSVEWNEIGADGVKALAIAVKKSDTLKKIKLGNAKKYGVGYNMIGDEGAVAVAKALEANGTVEEIRLSNNQIADRGGLELAQRLLKNNSLQKVVLGSL